MSRTNLAMYRMKKAKEILIEARDNLKQKHYGLSQLIEVIMQCSPQQEPFWR